MYFIEYENGTIMTLIATFNYIYAYQIDPEIGLIYNYSINLADILNTTKSCFIESAAIINNLLILLTIDY